jgi:NAD(P)H-hydrate epimerase
MSGAAALAGMSALRAGAGLVTVAVPRSCVPIVAAHEPSYMTRALPETEAGILDTAAVDGLSSLTRVATSWGIGPGLGRGDGAAAIVHWAYAELPVPMVIDADALNILAQQPSLIATHAGPRILTPHPGEFRRLLGNTAIGVQAQRDLAPEWARRHDVVLVLKGPQSLVADGSQYYVNSTGNPGMATGGSGDVLTGVISALLGQGLSPWDAARLGVHLHGLAGDLAAGELGEVSLIATDLVRFLPRAFREFRTT